MQQRKCLDATGLLGFSWDDFSPREMARLQAGGAPGWEGGRGEMLITHLLAGQAGPHYSESQRTVHILLLEGILLYQRLLEIRGLWLGGEVGSWSARHLWEWH